MDELIGDQPEAPYTTRDFALTERGLRYYTALKADFLDDATEAQLSQFKERFGSLPFRQLIRYVYRAPKSNPKLTDQGTGSW